MHSRPVSTIAAWACLLAMTTASPVLTERQGKSVLYERDSAKLTCASTTNKQWMGRDALNSAIGTFCGDAETASPALTSAKSVERRYNEGGPDAVSFTIDWPTSSSFKPNKADCVGYMTSIMDNCNGNDPTNNPLNWKHGGYIEVGDQRYNIRPITERYKSGVCSVHVHQKEWFWGVDGPGTARSHSYHLTVDAKDGDGTIIGGTNGQEVEAGQNGGSPSIFDGYYSTLAMTPEAQGDDYVQFTIGSQSWKTTDGNGVPRC